MEKWFIIGFCAWLANLLRAGSGGGGGGGSGEKNPQAAQAMARTLEFARNHIIAISISVTLAVIFLAAILILLMWLSSRGQFMFLDCLAKNKAEVRNPWKTFKQRANSLLGFRLLMIAIGFAVMIAVGIPTGFIIIAAKSSAFSLAAAVVMIFFAILFFIIVVCFFGFVQASTLDFVVPIMYLHGINVFAAWGKFLPVLKSHFWKLILYFLFKILIVICTTAITIAIFFIGCCFCCISVILLIPYIGTVILLPFPSFVRYYSLCFLRQFGSEFDVFTAAA
jgi:hypothetical protein